MKKKVVFEGLHLHPLLACPPLQALKEATSIEGRKVRSLKLASLKLKDDFHVSLMSNFMWMVYMKKLSK